MVKTLKFKFRKKKKKNVYLEENKDKMQKVEKAHFGEN